MKKKVLIIYPEMIIGGTTTSLLSILAMFDPDKYDIDLQLQYNYGILSPRIPDYVNVLPLALPRSRSFYKYVKIISPVSVYRYLKSKSKSGLFNSQCMESDIVKFSCTNKKEYDVAISFMELWSLYYLAKKVNAKKKIAWIHADYIGAKLYIDYDRPYFEKMDNIVFVSKKCLDSFQQIALPQKIQQKLDCDKRIKIISVCRVSFNDKGLDRGIYAMAKLKDLGLLKNIVWYIVGDGPDYEKLKEMIE